ncbi:amidohydrolase [Streptomyces sp. NBC_01336]|uniref:amidohydrolase family protein n=1 Tax=Streptomyces sp. NBC_01336 TaxID=2903829 RepID=UPI002E161AFB|nr:amidohydrolase [Streptomyces sp. NBC_01336]
MIDCHVHLWDPAGGFPWIKPGSEHHHPFGEGDLERSGAGLGLAGAILVEASRGDAGETRTLRELRLRRPDLIAGYVANLHVHGADGPGPFRALLHEWGASRPNGMRLGGTSWTDTPEAARALVPVLAEEGVVLQVNLHQGALGAAADVTERHPELKVVVDHLGNPPHLRTPEAGEWYRDIERAADATGVVVKISGLLTQQHGAPHQRIAHMLRHVVDTLGPDRCLIGSDWPICLPRGTRADSLTTSRLGLAHLTDDRRTRVLHTTPARVYGLDS